uniref:Uncharacterized protein n=1 Tax=Panagrolaimus sp. ES5 TaxID=591445 RepID=A0AC34FTF0_9BILA
MLHYDDSDDEIFEAEGTLFESDISDDDLGYFYDFCLMLPQLEKIGRIPKNKATQSTCKKLHIILDPLYRKTAETKSFKWI